MTRAPKPRDRKSFRHALAAIIVLIGLPACTSDSGSDPVRINNEPVGAEEYAFFAAGQQAEVFRYFAQRYGAEDGPDFWNRRFGGQSPAEMLRVRTLRELVRVKVALAWAARQGLLADPSYAAFIRQLESENLHRRARVDSGQVIYGPVAWDAAAYFSYRQSKIELALKRFLTSDTACLSEDRLVAAWDSLKATTFADDSVRLMRISTAKTSRGMAIDTAILVLSVSSRDGDSEGPHAVDIPLARLSPGETRVFRGADATLISVVCLERIHGFQSFALARPALEQMLVDAEFDRRLATASKAASIRVHH